MTRPSRQAAEAALPPDFALWERHVRAFVALAEHDADGPGGPLAGLRIAVKDVIDVRGLPTRNGSAACAQARPAVQDAPVVARLRAAGARIVGKTVTTEFAFTDPTDCRNPYATDRSPGGSSSGSGAAVGAGMVDIALGTQTAGSLIRPAAYCGAVGFKPGLGALPMAGVTPLSPSHDMVGIIARSVALAETAFRAMRDGSDPPSRPVRHAGRLALDPAAPVDPDWQAALDTAVRSVADGTGPVPDLTGPADLDTIVADHRTVMCAEAAQAHGHLLDGPARRLLQPGFREALLTGRGIAPAARSAAAARLAAARAAFWDRHAGIDVILSLPVPEGPPLLGGSTGFQHWLAVWTVLGGPLLCLPWGLDRRGLPLSVLLAAQPGNESGLLRFGRTLADVAPPMPSPFLPGR